MKVYRATHIIGSAYRLEDGSYKAFFRRAYMHDIPKECFLLVDEDTILEWCNV